MDNWDFGFYQKIENQCKQRKLFYSGHGKFTNPMSEQPLLGSTRLKTPTKFEESLSWPFRSNT
jgi:hypothetical protein